MNGSHRRRSDECHLGLIRAAGGGYYLLSAEGLLRGDAAVDDEPRAGHEGRVVRGEEHDALGDIVGCAHTADRQTLDDLATRRLDVVGAEIARPRDQHLVPISVSIVPGCVELTRMRYPLRANSSAADFVNRVTPPLVIE